VSIYRIFRSTAFEPEAVIAMSAAYEDALRVLKLADPADPITELVARKIIEVAQTGESNRTRLRDKALAELNKSTSEYEGLALATVQQSEALAGKASRDDGKRRRRGASKI
jgi:hypothetical protein